MKINQIRKELWPSEEVWVTRLHGVTFGLKDGERASGIFGTFVRQGGAVEWFTSVCQEAHASVSAVWSELLDDIAQMQHEGRYKARKRFNAA